jgi:hypothetical protein
MRSQSIKVFKKYDDYNTTINANYILKYVLISTL